MTPHGKGHSSLCPLLTKEDMRKTMDLKGRMRPKGAGLGISTVTLSLKVIFDVTCLDMSGASHV